MDSKVRGRQRGEWGTLGVKEAPRCCMVGIK